MRIQTRTWALSSTRDRDSPRPGLLRFQSSSDSRSDHPCSQLSPRTAIAGRRTATNAHFGPLCDRAPHVQPAECTATSLARPETRLVFLQPAPSPAAAYSPSPLAQSHAPSPTYAQLRSLCLCLGSCTASLAHTPHFQHPRRVTAQAHRLARLSTRERPMHGACAVACGTARPMTHCLNLRQAEKDKCMRCIRGGEF